MGRKSELLAICSLHLLQKPFPDPWETFKPEPIDGWAVLVVAFILLLCNSAGFLAVLAGVQTGLPTATMWMMMCLAVGGLIGFLFGVPRIDKRITGPSRGALRQPR